MTLNEWRKANRYSLPAFADLLFKKAGRRITHQTLSNYERGRTVPDVETADAIRRITGGKVRPDSFLRQG